MSEMEMVLFSTENKLKVGSKNKTSNTRSVVWYLFLLSWLSLICSFSFWNYFDVAIFDFFYNRQCSHGGHEGFYTLCDSKLKATIDIRNTSASFGHVLDFGLNEDKANHFNVISNHKEDYKNRDITASIWTVGLVYGNSTRVQISDKMLKYITLKTFTPSHPKENGLTLVWNLSLPSKILSLKKSDKSNENKTNKKPETTIKLNLNLKVNLVNGQLQYKLSFSTQNLNLSVWDWLLSPVGYLPYLVTDSFFQNWGYGQLQSPPNFFESEYPGQSTLQFIGLFRNQSNNKIRKTNQINNLNFYMGAHDSSAQAKHFRCTPHANQKMVLLSIGAVVPDAGLPFVNGVKEIEWPIVVTIVKGNWWDASILYRNWVLDNADWTKQGPLSKRKDIPLWAYNLTTWVNTHWQNLDIFEKAGGDPKVVLDRITNIQKRFNLKQGSLAVHWYEWDTLGYQFASNYSNCIPNIDNEFNCGFDTHYPEYFPARKNFKLVSQELQNRYNIRVIPYINGRIFDKGTLSWYKNNNEAQRYCAKNATPNFGAKDLIEYEEQYGSHAKFAVMCPNTSFWQNNIQSVTKKIIEDYGVDGVYIDQIAAAAAKPCFDKNHNHTVGGGHFWSSGYANMLDKVHKVLGDEKLIMTESNSEAFLGKSHTFLTLVAFFGEYLPPIKIDRKNQNKTESFHRKKIESKSSEVLELVPAFQAIYGGWIISAGSEFYRQDLEHDPNVFAKKVALQFVLGAQMGWFSLGGNTLGSTPPQGIYELLMKKEYDPEIEYLKLMSDTRPKIQNYFYNGRIMRNLPLPTEKITNDFVPTLLSSAWLSLDEASLLVILTSVKRKGEVNVNMNLDMKQYGFHSDGKFSVTKFPFLVNSEETVLVNVFENSNVNINVKLAARSLALFEVKPMSK